MKKIMIVIVMMLLTVSCSVEKEPIRIGVNSWPPCEVWYLADELGYFEDVSVDLVRFTAWSDNMASLYVDKIDITHATLFNSIYFSDKGEDAVILAPIDYIVGGDGLVIKNNLQSPEELKGKKIAVEIGTDEHYLLYKSLNLYGLSVEDVELVSKPSYEAHKVFIDGEVDGVFTYEPFLSQGAKEGDGKIAFTTKELPGHMIDALVASKKISEQRENDLKTVMNAWYKTLAYIEKHPEEAFKIMAVNENMDQESFEAFFNGFTFYTQKEAEAILSDDNTKKLLEEMQEFALENLLINEKTNIEELLESPMLNH